MSNGSTSEANRKMNTQQGHWLLAKMGKTVLRPGGKELTLRLINNLDLKSDDSIVEFAPGLGFTASIALKRNPRSYIGIESNEEAAKILRKIVNGKGREIKVGNAAESLLPEESANKVYGEAMLTMHANHRKSEIISEAYRILKKGGLYGIHELGLTPDELSDEVKDEIQRELAQAIRVNARPLTKLEWKSLLEKEGFVVKKVFTNPMHLLEPKRLVDDEGFFNAVKFVFNVLKNPSARKRIRAMRKVFRKYNKQMDAIAVIAEKI